MIIPDAWAAILADMQRVCPSAVLAGGCLRDLDNDKPVKDLDVFITEGSMQRVERIVGSLREAGYTVEPTFGDTTAYPEDQNLAVVAVVGIEHPASSGLAVQLIFTNWDTALITERFDYGICRLAFDGETLTKPPEYIEDKSARVFRLRRDRPTPVSMRGSIRRYARLVNEKYQGWDWWPYEVPEAEFI